MKEKKQIVVTITGQERYLTEMVSMFKTIQDLCSMGSSRTIHLWVDGDGAADLKFDFGDTDVTQCSPHKIEDTIKAFTLD